MCERMPTFKNEEEFKQWDKQFDELISHDSSGMVCFKHSEDFINNLMNLGFDNIRFSENEEQGELRICMTIKETQVKKEIPHCQRYVLNSKQVCPRIFNTTHTGILFECPLTKLTFNHLAENGLEVSEDMCIELLKGHMCRNCGIK